MPTPPLSLAAFLVSATLLAAPSLAQPGAVGTPQQRGRALEAMIESVGEAPLLAFRDEHLAPAYRDSFAPGELLAMLGRIRATCAHFGGIEAAPAEGGGTRLTFIRESGSAAVVFRLEPSPPHRIVALELETQPPRARRAVEVEPITWDNLESRLSSEAELGFSGAVLVRRGGEVVLHRGFGFADRSQRIPITRETLFAIGSVPIDFTKAAILKLAEAGRLSTSDAVGKHLKGVPEDKRAMTLDHLMSGRSGLPDFHDTEGDADKDLSWIDRGTAIGRILGLPLRFAPGEGQAHSHSAWVLLAAIVEIASGEPYGAYLKRQFFDPAGMTRTGNHEDGERYPDEAFAVGYEGQSAGDRNSPKHWGRTSWLVMGSGGMMSTPGDLDRWLAAIRTGRTLSPASAARYFTNEVLAGGDDRGFLCMYTQGPGDLMILCSNSHSGPGDRASAVGRRLAELVRSSTAPRFTLGIEFAVEEDGAISVHAVRPGSAAERHGLRAGDVLLTVDGTRLREPLMDTLTPLLQTGEALTFELERGGKRLVLKVNPDAKR